MRGAAKCQGCQDRESHDKCARQGCIIRSQHAKRAKDEAPFILLDSVYLGHNPVSGLPNCHGWIASLSVHMLNASSILQSGGNQSQWIISDCRACVSNAMNVPYLSDVEYDCCGFEGVLVFRPQQSVADIVQTERSVLQQWQYFGVLHLFSVNGFTHRFGCLRRHTPDGPAIVTYRILPAYLSTVLAQARSWRLLSQPSLDMPLNGDKNFLDAVSSCRSD